MIPRGIVTNGVVGRVFLYAEPFELNGVNYPRNIFDGGLNGAPLWSEAEFVAIGMYTINTLPPPALYHLAGTPVYTFNGTSIDEVRADTEMPLTDAQAQKLLEIRNEARQVIEVKWPRFKQQNTDAGIYTPAVKALKDADIASVITASNTAEDAVIAATTIAQIQAVTPVWPTL